MTHVTRDIDSPYYNAHEKGDLVSDTPAQFNGATNNVCRDNDDEGLNTFIEHVNVRDNSDIAEGGDGEMYINIDFRNYMGYYSTGLRTHFTDGQKEHMREFISNPINADIYTDITNLNIASLYEPYAGNYYYDGVVLPEHTTKFQYGFNYKFVACGTDIFDDVIIYNTPEWSDFEYDLSNVIANYNNFTGDVAHYITHPNHTAILIEGLDLTPHKCYNNFNRVPNSGSVIHYLDGVPNTNISISPKSETEINDTNLLQNLDNGLYIIKKNFNDGSQEQNTILKNEN